MSSQTVFDVCPNVDGIQTAIPDGWYQLDPPSRECRQFQYGGPESSHKDNPGSPGEVLGYGTGGGGDILGASTMAATGGFKENAYLATIIVGILLAAAGIKTPKKSLH